MKSAGKARNNGLYRHIRTSKEIIRNLLNDFIKNSYNNFLTFTLFAKAGVPLGTCFCAACTQSRRISPENCIQLKMGKK